MCFFLGVKGLSMNSHTITHGAWYKNKDTDRVLLGPHLLHL